MRLTLTRPLIFFDLETTGTDLRCDYVVQIAAVKHHPDGTESVLNRLVRPPVAIPCESAAVHGITDDAVANKPTFKELLPEIDAFFAGSDLAGYNIARFDIPMLVEEFKRCDAVFDVTDVSVLDAFRIFAAREPRTLSAALEFYCGEPLENAHDAEADVRATIRVLEGQLSRYPDLPETVAELDAAYNTRDPRFVDARGRLRWRHGEAVIGFGQKAGRSLREMVNSEPSYLEWILRSDFPDDVKEIVSAALRDGAYPKPPAN